MGANKSTKANLEDQTFSKEQRESIKNFVRRRSSILVDKHGNEVAEASLSDHEYEILIEQTGLSKSEIKSIFKSFIKQSTNGELDQQQFDELYKKLNRESYRSVEDNIEFVFEAFDKDGNGKLSFKEFIIAYVLTQSTNLEKKIDYTFDLYDVDKNGFLDIDEIHHVIARIFNLLGGEKKVGVNAMKFTEDCVRKIDANKDGKITKEEYTKALVNNKDLRILLTPFNT